MPVLKPTLGSGMGLGAEAGPFWQPPRTLVGMLAHPEDRLLPHVRGQRESPTDIREKAKQPLPVV